MAVRQADLFLLPYESTEQVTAGVLVEAIAAGNPVIAAAFPHAIELLGTDAGIAVPHGDPIAMAAASIATRSWLDVRAGDDIRPR